jgi:uncharacterized surface protein with fasciclin (FAS1) repeats
VKLNVALFMLLAGGLVLATPAYSGDCGGGWHAKAPQTASKDLVDTAVAAGSFGTLVKAVQAADLVETLKGDGPFTVFAPTDAAFAAVPQDTLKGLLADKAALTKVLTYHVVPGRIPASQVTSMDWAETAQGQSLRIESRGGKVMIDGATVVKADIETSNGIIHVIDRVILPRKDIIDTAVAAGSFKTLATAVTAAELVETLKGKGPFTVFAPADSAFAKLPDGTVEGLLKNKPALQGVLTYHVVPGRILAKDIAMGTSKVATANGAALTVNRDRDGNVTIDNAKVVKTDILAGNGVIHVIDSVVLPPQS